MPFREQEYKERCATCGNEMTGRCPRCGKNFCAKHRDEDSLCPPCGEEFKGRLFRARDSLEREVFSKVNRAHQIRDVGSCILVLGALLVGTVSHEFANDRFEYILGAYAVVVSIALLRIGTWLERSKARLETRGRERLLARFISSRPSR